MSVGDTGLGLVGGCRKHRVRVSRWLEEAVGNTGLGLVVGSRSCRRLDTSYNSSLHHNHPILPFNVL